MTHTETIFTPIYTCIHVYIRVYTRFLALGDHASALVCQAKQKISSSWLRMMRKKLIGVMYKIH